MGHTAEEGDLYKCSKCSSSHVDIYSFEKKKMQACLDCGYEEEIKK